MKYAAAVALLPLIAHAAPAPAVPVAETRDDGDDPNTVVKFDSFVTSSTVEFPEGTGTYVGQENATDVSLFRFNDGNVYSVAATQGDQLTLGPWGTRAATVGANGLCTDCVDESNVARRDLKERTFILLSLLSLKVQILSCILGWFKVLFGYKLNSGCLNGYPGGGNVWVGGPHGHQCGVTHGYIHYPHIPHLGWENGWGGKYCGSYQGIQYWWFQGGKVCGINVHRHRRRNGCSVPQKPNRPPVCNSCNDPSSGWWSTNKPNYWTNKHWWGSRSIDNLD